MEIILLFLSGFAAIFLATVVISIMLKLIKFTTVSITKTVQLVFVLIIIVFLSLLISEFLLKPLYYEIFAHTASDTDGTASMVVFSIMLTVLVLLFGKTPPFKIYGMSSIAFNASSTILTALLVHNSNYDVVNTSFAFASIDSANIFSVYLVYINIYTFFIYGYDKFIACIFPKSSIKGLTYPLRKHRSPKLARLFKKHIFWMKPPRVPEWILHWHSIFGGSIGALFGQRFFNHKTTSDKFQPVFIKAIALQIILLIGVFAIKLSFEF